MASQRRTMLTVFLLWSYALCAAVYTVEATDCYRQHNCQRRNKYDPEPVQIGSLDKLSGKHWHLIYFKRFRGYTKKIETDEVLEFQRRNPGQEKTVGKFTHRVVYHPEVCTFAYVDYWPVNGKEGLEWRFDRNRYGRSQKVEPFKFLYQDENFLITWECNKWNRRGLCVNFVSRVFRDTADQNIPSTALWRIRKTIRQKLGFNFDKDFVRERIIHNNDGTCTDSPVTTTESPVSSTTHVPTTTAPSPNQNFRIPLALVPVFYTVELQPNMYEGDPEQFTFDGFVKIRMNCLEDTNNITLHIKQINITTGSILVTDEGSGNKIEFEDFFEDKEREFLIITFTNNLVKDRVYSVATTYVGPLKNDLSGLYLSSYQRGGQPVYLATSQLQATDARKVFPCFDEPAIKAKFDITIVRKNHFTSISNMPIKSKEDRGNGLVADKFETTLEMSTYLLAFVVSDFKFSQNFTTGGVKYRVWSRPEAVSQTDLALHYGIDIITFFEEFYGVKFPLDKQDMAAIPDFAAGAMENWGLILYREALLLFDPNEASEADKQLIGIVVSHELSHQWFGNLVSPAWWDDLSLNEGFANFMENLGMSFLHPEWLMFEQRVVQRVHKALNSDGLVTSHPVYVEGVSRPEEIFSIFDDISYIKGGSTVKLMQFFLGQDTFRRGLTKYFEKFKFSVADHDDLFFTLGNQSLIENKPRSDVKNIMDTWILQKNYPVVMVTRNYDNKITLTQQRFIYDPEAEDPGWFPPSPFNYTWEIPFTFTTSEELDFNKNEDDIVWMHRTDPYVSIKLNQPLRSKKSWVVANVQQVGFFRVNYDQNNWLALVDQLESDHPVIHFLNRAQIIDDAWNLVISGDLRIEVAFETLRYLNKEESLFVWTAVQREMTYVRVMLQKTNSAENFAKFMRSKLRKIFSKVGMTDNGGTHLELLRRERIVSDSCLYGIQTCVDNSKKLFQDFMTATGPNPIDINIRSAVFCTAMAHGTRKEWDFLYGKYKASNVATERDRILIALACSSDKAILSNYIILANTPGEVRSQDTTRVWTEISKNPIGQPLVWEHVTTKWDEIFEKFGGFSLIRLIEGVTASFNTAEDLKELEDFIKANPNLGAAQKSATQAIEKTKINIKWMQKNFAIIEKFLDNDDSNV